LTNPMQIDPNLFPGLRFIRIRPQKILGHANGSSAFNERTLEILKKWCRRRNVELTFDAEPTR
jgi:hypothetical protein